MKSLDANNDGVFNANDTAWNTVKVWVDVNHDGKSWNDANNNNAIDAGEAGELKTLAQIVITQINLANQAQSGEVRDGNEVLARRSFSQWVDANGNPVIWGDQKQYRYGARGR